MYHWQCSHLRSFETLKEKAKPLKIIIQKRFVKWRKKINKYP
jgi:hypothetical protein